MAVKGSSPSCALFCWGFGKYGQLGVGDQSTKELPQLITNPSFSKDGRTLTSISCGGHYTLVTTSSSDKGSTVLYSCGRGLYGRLGNGTEDDQNTFKPLTLKGVAGTVSVSSAGHWHGCLITTTGQLYSWGYNKTHNVLGVTDHIVSTIPVYIPMEVPLSAVSCGFNYTIALSSTGTVYSWGSGRYGVLGQGDYDDWLQPTLVQLSTSIPMSKVHCGYCHVGFISRSEGHLYTCGKGSDGALGHGKDKNDKLRPCRVEEGLPLDCRVIDVSCSQGEHHSHTLIATDNGTVYSWGDGYKCKLGHGDDKSKLIPTRIDPIHFKGWPITGVACGGIHSVAIATGYAVFTWGCGSDGRLGHPEAHGHRYLFLSSVPRQVEGFGAEWTPFDVSCSYYHTAALCSRRI